MQLNFSEINIFNEFNNKTNFFKKDFIELNNFKNYTKTIREDIDYFEEVYEYDENISFDYYTNKVLISFIGSLLSIIKSLFVALLLVFGTFLFTKVISFYVISPLEKLFAKLEMLFNNLDFNLHQQLELEIALENNNNNKNNTINDVNNVLNKSLKSGKVALVDNSDKKLQKKDSLVKRNGILIIRNLNKDDKSIDYDLELGRVNQEEDKQQKDIKEIKGNFASEFETSDLKKINNEKCFIKNNTKEINNNNNEIDIIINNKNNNDNDNEDKKKLSEKAEKPFFSNQKPKSNNIAYEIEKIDFSIMKLLDLISVTIGNPMLMMIPYCDLELDLVINLKSPSVIFEGFALMLNFSNKENLYEKIGAKACKYFNRVITLFHSVGLIFCGQPYKIDEADLIIWRKDQNSYTKNMFTYIQGLGKLFIMFTTLYFYYYSQLLNSFF